MAEDQPDESGQVQSKRQTEGVRDVLSQAEPCMAPGQSLVWKAEIPEGPGCKAQAGHTGVLEGTEGEGAVLLRVIEDRPLLQELA